MTKPWLSVLMPTYNGASYLRDSLDSVVEQAHSGVECIAVDDGSGDETVAILDSYRNRLNLTVLARERVGNWVANTNFALERAQADFTCLLHQDDVWMPGRLDRIKDAVTRNPTVDLFVHPVWFIDGAGRRVGRWNCPLPKEPTVLDPGQALPRLLTQNFIGIPAPVFRTRMARDVGGLDEALWNTADWDFWLKLAAAGSTLCLPDPLACFRVHSEAQTVRRSSDITDFRRQHELVLERHLPKLSAPGVRRRRVWRAAELSIAVNMALASRYHGLSPDWAALASALWRARPTGIWHYWRNSRIGERVAARLRARKLTFPVPSTEGPDAVAR